jgi:23S rRNA (adenine2503-C2)-methyltransferase
MGCNFCASGKDGLVRNLSAGEILAEVLLINKLNSDKNEKKSRNEQNGQTEKNAQIEHNTKNEHNAQTEHYSQNEQNIQIGYNAKNKFNAQTERNTQNERGVTNIVLMGSGEPLDNFDSVMKFLELVTAADGINISGRNISLSTSGIVPQIKRFADLGGQVNLCISLHAPNDEIRRQIMPIAKKYSIKDLIDSAKYYFNKTHRRVIFEYSLMCSGGVPINCSPENARELAALVRGFPAHINLINLNPTPSYEHSITSSNCGRPLGRGTLSPLPAVSPCSARSCGGSLSLPPAFHLTPPDKATAMKFMDTVIKSGVSCTMRKNRGDDIDGACGQLRLRYVDK